MDQYYIMMVILKITSSLQTGWVKWRNTLDFICDQLTANY